LYAVTWELARLSHGHEATAESLSNGRTEEEASSIKTYDSIDLAVAIRLCSWFERSRLSRCGSRIVERRDGVGEKMRDNVGDEQLECQRVAQNGEDVAESDSLLGVIVVEACFISIANKAVISELKKVPTCEAAVRAGTYGRET